MQVKTKAVKIDSIQSVKFYKTSYAQKTLLYMAESH